MHHNPQVYFGAPDRQMESFLDANAFRRALVHGVLFHGDLVIPDIFLYISNRLAELVTSDPYGRAFLGSCIRNGAVIPAFRTDTQGSFHDNLEEIQRQGIQGIHTHATGIADVLQQAVRGKRLHYIVWPSDPFSVGYKDTLERALLTESLPSGSPGLEQFWETTQKMRTEVIGGTERDSLGGIRRGDIYNSLASYLRSANGVVHDIRTVWTDLQDQQLSLRVQRLLKWVNYCYHFNHGRMFSLHPALASLDVLDAEFARHLAQLRSEESVAPIIKQGFRFLSTDALLTVDPAYIIEVRESEVGANYFSALAAWQASPSEDSAQVLLDSLERYVSRLRGLYLERGRSPVNWGWYFRAFIPAGRSRWAGVGRDVAAEAAKEAAGSLIPGIGLVSVVGKLAGATYESLPASSQDALGPWLGIGKRVRIEVEEQTTRVSADIESHQTTDASFE